MDGDLGVILRFARGWGSDRVPDLLSLCTSAFLDFSVQAVQQGAEGPSWGRSGAPEAAVPVCLGSGCALGTNSHSPRVAVSHSQLARPRESLSPLPVAPVWSRVLLSQCRVALFGWLPGAIAALRHFAEPTFVL